MLKSSALWPEPPREVAYITLSSLRVNVYFKQVVLFFLPTRL
ncbi:hypothetical protein BN1221_02662c [Brenneria goodwinii]|uniref:Uncharacterized protein n=1 Tax=Brenneria goodwinii TaxID=1109412 RepID=A0A0G4JWA5_9GAMM|nr:hypothetical protein BN1221_02130c [Brenneria goodwinii]CPR17482.1 hypothetical protein BN1221_02662c [Brenneria goodwinii]